MLGVRADVALARVACRRDVGPIEQERDARLVHVEPFSEPNDVGKRDPVGTADDLAKADASASARARIAALGGRLARDVESSQPIAKLLGLGAWLELGELLGFANRVRAAVAVNPFVVARVDPIEVAAHDALEVRAQHCLCDPRAARHLHAEDGHAVGAHQPHPARRSVLPMTRLVEPHHLRRPRDLDQLLV